MAHKAMPIVLIFNEYHQFRIWHKFISTNFTEKKQIDSTAKDMEV